MNKVLITLIFLLLGANSCTQPTTSDPSDPTETTKREEEFEMGGLESKIFLQHPEMGEGFRALVRVVYNEARGEEFLGKMAVAEVVMNRAYWSLKDVPKVVKEPNQFANEPIVDFNIREYLTCFYAVKCVLDEVSDYSNRATHFYNDTQTEPRWALDGIVVAEIGNHTFVKIPQKLAPNSQGLTEEEEGEE